MKKTILVSKPAIRSGLCPATIQAQDTEKKVSEEGFVFTTVKENPFTSVKNQNSCLGYVLVLLLVLFLGVGVASYGKGRV